jgi:hypothetical protein
MKIVNCSNLFVFPFHFNSNLFSNKNYHMQKINGLINQR